MSLSVVLRFAMAQAIGDLAEFAMRDAPSGVWLEERGDDHVALQHSADSRFMEFFTLVKFFSCF